MRPITLSVTLSLALLAACGAPSNFTPNEARDDQVSPPVPPKKQPWRPAPGTRPSGCWDGGCHVDDSGMFP